MRKAHSLLLVGALVAAVTALAVTLEFAGESASHGDPAPDVAGRGAAVGDPEPLARAFTVLSAEEQEIVESVALGDPEIAETLKGDRYRVVEGEITHEKDASCGDLLARECATVGIFSYTDGNCVRALVSLEKRRSLAVYDTGGCSVSEEEVEEARRIAEADERAMQIVEERHGMYQGGRAILPRDRIAGHRYVSAKYGLDRGMASAEFVIDLTTQSLCFEC